MQRIRMWAVGALALSALGGCADEKPIKVADTKAMMNQHVQPEAEIFWQAVQYISDENGSREISPQNDAEWNRTAEAARKLKALGESLKQPEYAQGKGADWLAFTQGMVDVAGQAEQAALTHSKEKVLEVGGTLYNVCSACHEVYMPSPGGLAPTDQASTKPTG